FFCLQLNSEKMYMGVPDLGQDFLPVGQFRVPELPSQSQQNMKQAGGPWKREAPTHLDSPRLPWVSKLTVTVGSDIFQNWLSGTGSQIAPPKMQEPLCTGRQSITTHTLISPVDQTPAYICLYFILCFSKELLREMLFHSQALLTKMSRCTSQMQQMANSESSRYSSHPKIEAMGPRIQSVTVQHGHMATFNQSQLGLSGASVTHSLPSPPGSKSATPSPSSSVHEDEPEDSTKASGGEKRPASTGSKKPKTPKKKKKKDPNEPQKPVSAYALFFRDTQAAIKGQNPSATFGEVSKIVASMWDGLGEEQKQTYKKKTETAKKEYLKQLAAYRASLVSQVTIRMGGFSLHYEQLPLALDRSATLPAQRKGCRWAPLSNSSACGHRCFVAPWVDAVLYARQGFPMQTEFQSAVNSTASTLTAQMDLAHGGCRNPMGPGLDWAGSYCSAGSESLQREKPLYLH
uniref:Thymocyte selection-associated high mobility group box n=1 Tax=Paramormyrops kingsleyae TaxID=1676925 RepID=A0A3B3RTZ9_9TELE